ncbi:unnamed protein product, partial [Adineta steineri]
YGYGFLAVFIISILSLAGFLAFPLMKKPYYKYLNAFFTALAVGTLFADTTFELLPVIIQSGETSTHVHEHGQTISNQHSDRKIHIPLFLWQMATLVITAYIFYVIELFIHVFMHHRHHRVEVISNSNPQALPMSEINVSQPHRNDSLISTNTVPNLTITADERQTKSTGWMIIIGDGIHNVADGLAIGAAFAENTMFGLTTSIAIACHELPTELGEYMVLIESGFTIRQALLFNFISACTAIIGFFIGASIAQNEAARTWIFAVTAGTFAYIALVDLRTSSIDTDDTKRKLDNTINSDKLQSSFVRHIIDTIGFKSGDSHHKSGPTNAEKYGYGFLSVFIISTFSLGGALIFPLTKKPYYKYLNAFFTALAVGALYADSAFELFPSIIQFDGHSSKSSSNETQTNETEPANDDDEPTVPYFLWQMLLIVLTSYVFYVLELMIVVVINYRNRQSKDDYSLDHENLPVEAVSTLPILTRDRGTTIVSATFPNYSLTPDDKQTPAIGWMIIIGDGIHNVADGLAIGAAFSENILFGITTAIAIACHELPTELGEMMILIESGFTIRRALLFNLFSACTAFIGFFIGASLSADEASRTWIFSITAGIFIYIALVDLWPSLMPESDVFDWIRFACVTVGYLSGVFVMFGLAILTEQVIQDPQNG